MSEYLTHVDFNKNELVEIRYLSGESQRGYIRREFSNEIVLEADSDTFRVFKHAIKWIRLLEA